MQFYPSGARIADRYEVAGRPLVGGMGVVYLCFDHQVQRPVALKTFKPEFLPDRAARQRFLREGTAWMQLGAHPHIVQAYGVERIGDGTEIYLVLELVAKEQGRQDASLRSHLIPGRPLPIAQALGYAVQIARGMAHATATLDGFVHRDLKPENVLVGADRLANTELNRLRVTDFGLARTTETHQTDKANEASPTGGAQAGLTRVGALLGTPAYMAPEQWASADITLHADIYALGCILGELLTGKQLVQAPTLSGYRQAHREGRALQMTQAIPAELRDVLAHCLAVEPMIRYVTWHKVEQALAALYNQVTGQALPENVDEALLNRAKRIAVGWSYSDIGSSYLDLGQAARSLDFFTKVQQVGQIEGERKLESAGLNQLGAAYLRLGNIRQAIGYFEQALAISRRIGDRQSEGVTLSNLGRAYQSLGDIRQSISYYEQALTIRKKIGDHEGEGADLNGLGDAYRDLGDARRAIIYYEQSLTIHQEIDDRRGESANLIGLGHVFARLGNIQRAIGYYEQALAIAREIGDRHGEGVGLGNLGEAHRQLGDARRAIGYYEQALAIDREIGDRQGERGDLGNLGIAYLQLGKVEQAIRYFAPALAIAQEIGDRQGESQTLGNLGIVYKNLGDARRAIGYYEQALAIAQEIGDRRGQGADLSNLGSAYLQLGDARRAIGYYEQALTIRREIGDTDGMATDSFNMAVLHTHQGETVRALPLAREAARLWSQIGHSYAKRAQQLVGLLEQQGG